MNCRYRKTSLLPSGYTQLKWISPDGAAYINTELYGTQNIKIEETLQLNSIPSGIAAHTFGDFTTNTQAITINLKPSGNSRFESTSNTDVFGTIDLNKHTYGVSKNGFTIDGVVTKSLSNIADFTTTKTLLWMSSNYTSMSAIVSPDAKYHELKIWDNGVLVRDYIPAKNSSNEVGAYDLCGSICSLTNTPFYPNVGSGDFIAGPEEPRYSRVGGRYRRGLFVNGKFYKVPSDVTPMTYVKGDGSVYIKTPLTSYKNTYKYKLGIRRYSTSVKFVSFQNPSENENTIGMFSDSFGYRFQNGRVTRRNITVSAGVFHDIVIESDGYSVDGTKTAITPVSEFTANSNLYLFAGCNDTTIDDRISDDAVSYYYVEDSSGNLLMALIPATKNYIVGVFDLVSQQFIAPTRGALTAGTALTKDQIYQSVEKIERKDGNVYKEIPLGFARSVSGASPLTVPDARALPLSKLELQGNAKRGIKIDGVVYPIPDGITPLEYAVFDGSTYIKTGIIPSGKKIGAIVDFQFTNASRTAGGMVGSNETDGTNNCQFTVYESKWRVKINNYATYGARYNTNRHTLRLNTPNGTGLDDTVYTATQYTVASSNATEMYLGACNYNSSSTLLYSLIGKLYSALFYDDTTLIRAYIPAIQNNIVGYYDFVTQQFIAPTGGTLTAGPEAPTPDCPLEILGVGDKTENLFDSADMTIREVINADGSTTSSTVTNHSNYIAVEPNTTYTVKDRSLFLIGTTQITRYHAYGSDKSWLSQITSETVNTTDEDFTVTFTTPSNCYFVRFTTRQPRNNAVIMLVKGSTAPAPYIPYGHEVTLRKSGRNLFDMHYDVSYQGSYPNITEVAGGKSTEWIETSKFTNPYGYYSLNPITPSALCVFGLVYSNDKSTILYRDGGRNTADLPANTQYFGTTSIDKTYAYVKFYISSWSTINNAGVYVNSQTEYEPYFDNTYIIYTDKPLFKSGNYTDLLEAISGVQTDKWGVKVLDGSETWTDASSGTKHIYYLPLSDRKTDGDYRYGLCSHFGYSTGTSSTCPDLNVFYYDSLNTGFRYDAITSLADWRAYLAAQYAAGTPVIVIYPLATATTSQKTPTPVTPAKGTNYIASTNEVPALNIEVGYFKKTP